MVSSNDNGDIKTKTKTKTKSRSSNRIRPALNPESREKQLINLAINLAEEQLRDGTASSQVISHYLKLGSTKNKTEHEILLAQKELITAKTETLYASKRVEELYNNAIAAMKSYSGNVLEDDDYDE